MKHPFRKIALAFTALTCAAGLAAEPEQPKIDAVRKVMSVEEVTVRAVEGKPAQLTIEAAGMVNSGGWSHPALRAVKGAAEGTLTFEFVARPPGGPATMALAPIKATVTVDKPAGYREVQVVAQGNTKTAK